ncbi:alpha/beta hydrolase [Nocardia sp. NPDC001965]
MSTIERENLKIPTSSGHHLDSWLYLPATTRPLPTVVMAHGLGGIKAAGLAPFAEFFADHGFAALVFDYRHWGSSQGSPREYLSIRRQREDYHTALQWAAEHESLDRRRLFAWGTSFAGMHILDLAVSKVDLAGAIAQCPLADGFAGTRATPPRRAFRLGTTAVADLIGGIVGRSPRYLPINTSSGGSGVIANDDAIIGLQRLAPRDGSAWPNQITARSVLDISVHRPVRTASRVRCPLLMVVAETDSVAPTTPALKAAMRAPRGELYRSRGGHYDVYEGGLDHQNVLRVELEFLKRHSKL